MSWIINMRNKGQNKTFKKEKKNTIRIMEPMEILKTYVCQTMRHKWLLTSLVFTPYLFTCFLYRVISAIWKCIIINISKQWPVVLGVNTVLKI